MVLSGSLLYAQDNNPFYFPLTVYETTESLGYKPEVKTVTEYENKSKTVKSFNRKGVLISDESYLKNDNGYYLLEKVNYHFQKGRLTGIEAVFEVELMETEDSEDMSVRKVVYETETADYTYDKKGRLKAYAVLDRYYNNQVFHVHYPDQSTTQYYYMKTDSDSTLVYERKLIEQREFKTEQETQYINGEAEYTNNRYFKNGKAYKLISESHTDNKITQYSSYLNEYGDETEFIVSEKQDNETDFKDTWHEYLTYEYDEDGVKLKEFHTNEFEKKALYEERKIDYTDNQKTVTTKSYSGNDWVNTETIETYNSENEPVYEIIKEKHNPDEDFTEIKTTTYKREYSFY